MQLNTILKKKARGILVGFRPGNPGQWEALKTFRVFTDSNFVGCSENKRRACPALVLRLIVRRGVEEATMGEWISSGDEDHSRRRTNSDEGLDATESLRVMERG